MNVKINVHTMLEALLLTWIGATALFFFLRFSIIFYHANASAIRAAWDRFFS